MVWELITIMLEPKTLAPWLLKFGYLPTQSVTGESYTNGSQSLSFPYYEKMISMIPLGHVRPSIAEYPMIAGTCQSGYKGGASGRKRTPDRHCKDVGAVCQGFGVGNTMSLLVFCNSFCINLEISGEAGKGRLVVDGSTEDQTKWT